MVEKDYIEQLMDKVGEDKEDSPLVITPAQARYIAEYLDQEFNISQKNGHGEGRWGGYDLDYAIMDAVQAMNGGAMDGFGH